MFSLLLDSSAKDSDRQKVTEAQKSITYFYHSFSVCSVFTLLNCIATRRRVCIFQAAQNLVVLSREDAGAEQIFRNDGVKLIQKLLQSKQEEVVLSALRTLVGLCTGHQSRVSVILPSKLN